jgi:hypothetical protein
MLTLASPIVMSCPGLTKLKNIIQIPYLAENPLETIPPVIVERNWVTVLK